MDRITIRDRLDRLLADRRIMLIDLARIAVMGVGAVAMVMLAYAAAMRLSAEAESTLQEVHTAGYELGVATGRQMMRDELLQRLMVAFEQGVEEGRLRERIERNSGRRGSAL